LVLAQSGSEPKNRKPLADGGAFSVRFLGHGFGWIAIGHARKRTIAFAFSECKNAELARLNPRCTIYRRRTKNLFFELKVCKNT
jgi:hypothetical protein